MRSTRYAQLVEELVNAGDLIPKADDLYEDMGGHLVRFENLEFYIESYVKALTPKEREQLFKRLDFEEVNFS